MSKIKVLVTVPELEGRQDILDQFASLSSRIEIKQRTCRNMEEAGRALVDAEVLYTLWFPAQLAEDNRLRWLQMTSTGIDNKLIHPVFDPERNITVTTASGCHAVPIAEYCLFAMGILIRGLMHFYRDQQNRVRDRSHSTLTDLWGKTLGIVGYGHIGREVARLARSFHMRILAAKKHPERHRAEGYEIEGVGDPDGSFPDKIFGTDDLDALYSESDIIVSCLPLTAETTDFFNGSTFGRMKKSAFFINVSRGGVVDHDALVSALEQKDIAGACLDVLFSDPKALPAEHPLWGLDNVFITPHISGNRNADYMKRSNDLFSLNLKRYLGGQPLLNAVTRDKGY